MGKRKSNPAIALEKRSAITIKRIKKGATGETESYPVVPLEERWKIASGGLLKLSFLYDKTFRKVVGDSFDYFEYEVFHAFGKDHAGLIADSVGLPRRNAPEIAQSWACISRVLFGPEQPESTPIEESEDRLITQIAECPYIHLAAKEGLNGGSFFKVCEGFNRGVVKALNPEYSVRIPQAICKGAKKCEMIIERRPWEGD